MNKIRCQSPICITIDNIRGRMFIPTEKGIGKTWCTQCISTGEQMAFFTHETANMIRDIYRSYIDTSLPREVKLILEQFVREVVQKLNEEL